MEIPDNIELSEFIGNRIFATGLYYQDSRTLKVNAASDMEILPPESENIPTLPINVTMTPTNSPMPTPIPTSIPTFEVDPTSRFDKWR